MRFEVDDSPAQSGNEFPDMGVFEAILEDIKDRTHARRDGTGEITFLDWYFTITGSDMGDQFIGRKVRGSTLAVLRTNGGELDRKFHNWSSAILGKELPAGYPLDTDDLLGLTVQVVVEMEPDRRDPSRRWPRVTDVANLQGQSNNSWTGGNEAAPF